MIHPALPASLLALTAPLAAVANPAVPARARVEITQVSIHERIIIRVPRMFRRSAQPVGSVPLSKPREWKERKGPKCVAVAEIAGAFLGQPGSVDLVMQDSTRLRAKLDGDCKPLDYYPGFYLRPSGDGLICRDRDAIRMRSGARCEIDDFKTLKLKQ